MMDHYPGWTTRNFSLQNTDLKLQPPPLLDCFNAGRETTAMRLQATFIFILVAAVTLIHVTSEAWAEPPAYSSCCVCIHDTRDVKMLGSVCKQWMSETKKTTGCRYRKIISKDDALDFNRVADDSRCDSLHLYGAFHGNSSVTETPFKFSVAAASAYQAKSVCYDGITCMVFDNIDDVKACARETASIKGCRFEITGNQNIGLGTQPFFCFRAREIPEAASKLTAVIEESSVKLRYANCSAKGAICGYLPSEGGWSRTYAKSKNNPNAKWCTDDGVIVEQRCCPDGSQNLNPDSMSGIWAAPGEACS